MNLYSAPAYTIGKSIRTNSLKKTGQPGPTTYKNVSKSKHRSPSWKINTARRNSVSSNHIPGPGSYATQKIFVEKSKGVSFKGRPGSAMGLQKNTPGPGEYMPHYQSVMKNEPAYRIPSDKRMSERDLRKVGRLPGPGAYDSMSTQNWKNGPRFGSSERDDYRFNTNPGPCTYSTAAEEIKLKKSVPKFSFGSSERIVLVRPSSPGPGAYQVEGEIAHNLKSKKGYKIPVSKKAELIIGSRMSPGPGSYETNPIIRASPAYTISGGPVTQKFNPVTSPGPTSYNPLDLNSKMGAIIGRAKRDSVQNNKIPGPGDYDQDEQFGQGGPKYTITSKHENTSHGKSPGPADYSVKYNTEHINTPIIKREGDPHILGTSGLDSPGPGYYNPKQFNTVGYSIGKEKRNTNRRPDSPGPGEYDIPSTISNLPQYTHLSHDKSRLSKKSIV